MWCAWKTFTPSKSVALKGPHGYYRGPWWLLMEGQRPWMALGPSKRSPTREKCGKRHGCHSQQGRDPQPWRSMWSHAHSHTVVATSTTQSNTQSKARTLPITSMQSVTQGESLFFQLPPSPTPQHWAAEDHEGLEASGQGWGGAVKRRTCSVGSVPVLAYAGPQGEGLWWVWDWSF